MVYKKNILLIISGSISAYKALYLIRLLTSIGCSVKCVMTKSAEKFVTPLSVASLSGHKVYTDLFNLIDETNMGHIRLSRESDLILVVPASANIIAKIANGIADDLASSILLASNTPIAIAPSMNLQMWNNHATKRNIKLLKLNKISIIEPEVGDLACGEEGHGRLSEPKNIVDYISKKFFSGPLDHISIVITGGPTQELIDPVRYISNRSSGIQSYTLAESLASLGAKVTLVSGPTFLPKPNNIYKLINIKTADEMMNTCEKLLPTDVFICAAAVTDWKVINISKKKIKKLNSNNAPKISLKCNPDILSKISSHKKRPSLLIGFAAETENIIKNAKNKLKHKNCDLIIANNVSEEANVFGSEMNKIYIINKNGNVEILPKMKKKEASNIIAEKIVKLI